MKKAAIVGLFFFLFMTPILSIASGNDSSAALETFISGNVDDMVMYVTSFLDSAEGKKQIEKYYLPRLKKLSDENLEVRFEWLFYPTYFSNEDPAKFLDTLESMIINETCKKDKCTKEVKELDDYAALLLEDDSTENLHRLTHDQMVKLLQTDLNAVSGNEIIPGDGVPEDYLKLREQYKMAYPFKEKFTLYAPFGYSEIYGTEKHYGADLNKSPKQCCGIKIYSVSSGVVTYKGKDSYGANLLKVKTGDVTVLYAHMSQPSPYVAGEVINKGDFVGYVGTTGYSTGCHLHLEMRWNNMLINPEVFIDLKNGRSYF